MMYRIVERATRSWPYQIRHPALATLSLLEALPRPILVYQMSKVGSTSVQSALTNAGLPPLHVHFLGDMSHEVRARYRKSTTRTPIHVSLESLLRPYLRFTSHRLKVVTLVRDPIARTISGFFHVHRLYDRDVDDVEGSLAGIRERILTGQGIDYCADWFDQELRVILGVDVLASEFDRARGFSVVPGPRVDVLTLTLKLEKLDDNWQVLSEFVGAPVEPARTNQRAEMEGAEAYREVRKRLRLPRTDVASFYDHPWMRHFYAPDEIQAFCDRWGEA